MKVIHEETPKRPAVEPCGQCPINSQCCSRGIEVHPAQVELIETLPLAFPKPWFTERPLDWHDGTGERHSTTVTSRGCIFLTDDLMCGIHRYCLENGLDVKKYKPYDCVEYPFLHGKLNSDYPIFCGVYFGEPVPEVSKKYTAVLQAKKAAAQKTTVQPVVTQSASQGPR